MSHSLSGIPSLQDFTVAQIEIWLLVLVRVSMLVALMPIVMTDEVPGLVKAGVAFFLSIILFPTVPPSTVEMPGSVLGYFLLALREVYIGAVMGFAGTFVFSGLRFAGSWIDQETGFAMMQLFNPMAQEEDTPMGHLLFIIFIMLMLGTGGYIFYLQAMAESFRLIPLAAAKMATGPMVAMFAGLSANAFILGLKVAAPVVTALFVSSMGLAIIARIMPQMNVWLVGMPMKLALGMMTLSFALPVMWHTFLGEQSVIHAYCIGLMRLLGS